MWILIVMWLGTHSNNTGKTSLAVEFRTKEACLTAAAEIRKQYPPQVILCAHKGNVEFR